MCVCVRVFVGGSKHSRLYETASDLLRCPVVLQISQADLSQFPSRLWVNLFNTQADLVLSFSNFFNFVGNAAKWSGYQGLGRICTRPEGDRDIECLML
jgi:hypothetical protein